MTHLRWGSKIEAGWNDSAAWINNASTWIGQRAPTSVDVYWTGKSSGLWTTKADWSNNTVPGSTANVSISVAGVTVTISSGNQACYSLYTSSSNVALTGGSLTVGSNADIQGNYSESGGQLILNGEGGFFSGTVTETKGTLTVSHGTLSLDGNANLDSVVSGYGTLVAGNGYDNTINLNPGVSLTVSHFDIESGNVDLNTNLVYAGNFSQTGGSLTLNGKVLMLSGNAYLGGGALSTQGTVIAAGQTQLAGFQLNAASVLIIEGAATVTQTADIADQSGSTAMVRVTSTGSLTFEGGAGFYSYGSGTLSNAGAINKISAQTTTIGDDLINTGTLDVAAGVFSLDGTASTLAGHVIGAGTLDFDSGNTTLSNGVAFGVASAEITSEATLTITSAQTFAGLWGQSGYGTLSFAGAKAALTLSGDAALESGTISGAGTLLLDGAAQLGSISIVQGAVVDIALSATQDSTSIDLGEAPASTADLDVLAGATYTLAGDTSINGYGTLTVAGTLNLDGLGTTTVNPDVAVLGKLQIGSASLQFESGVTGAGTIDIGGGGLLAFEYNANIAATTTVDFAAAGGILDIEKASGFAATLAGFASGDIIELNDFNISTSKFTVSGDNVTIKDSSNDSITLHFNSAQTASELSLGIGPSGENYLALIHD